MCPSRHEWVRLGEIRNGGAPNKISARQRGATPRRAPKSTLDLAYRHNASLTMGPTRPGNWWFTANCHPALPRHSEPNHRDPVWSRPCTTVSVDNRAQKSETSSGKAGSGSRNLAAIFTTEGRENVSPVFEAWLQAYRRRLEASLQSPGVNAPLSGKTRES